MFDNMKKSEKLLAGAVGVLMLCGAVTIGFLDTLKQYKDNKSQLNGLVDRINEEEYKMQLAIQASDRQGLFYEPISFSSNKNEITVYQDWLEKTIRDSGIRINSIGNPKTDRLSFTTESRSIRPIGKKHSITVVGTGTLNEIIEFCYHFEEIDVLHRIRELTLLPTSGRGSKAGDVKATIKVELLALENVEETRPYFENKRKLPVELAEYKKNIIGRNIFGPANNAPRLMISNKTVEEEEDISVSVTVRDDDKDDEFTFEIIDDGGLKDAEIKPSGKTRAKFVASAMPIGEYTVIAKVIDSGFPQKSAEKEFKITVEEKEEEPEKPVKPPVTPPDPVLQAPSTQITRISSRNGVYKVKINNRMTGQEYILEEGDEFELDEKTWKVKKINKYGVMIEVDGEVLEFRNFLDKPLGSSDSEPEDKGSTSEDSGETSEDEDSDGIAADETADESETTAG